VESAQQLTARCKDLSGTAGVDQVLAVLSGPELHEDRTVGVPVQDRRDGHDAAQA
jgi:hypothetical protein